MTQSDDIPEGAPQSLALHLGAHKTATTHLQKTLYLNRKMLADNQMVYYGPHYLRQPGHSVRHLFGLKEPLETSPRRAPMAQLAHMARGRARVVISEENFWGLLHRKRGSFATPIYSDAGPRLQQLADNLAPVKIQLFVSIREPASFLVSAYGQALYGRRYLTLADYLGKTTPLNFRWSHLLGRLAALRGIADIYVWKYEDYRAVQRLVMRRMLRWKLGPMLEPITETVHGGLSAHAVEETLGGFLAGKDGNLAEAARDAFPISEAYPKFAPFAPGLIEESQAIYEADIKKIAALPGVTFLQPPRHARESV